MALKFPGSQRSAHTHSLKRRSPSLTRRDLLRLGALGAGASLLPAGRSRAGVGPGPHRFLQINLEGGWDSAFACDPVVGTKRTEANGGSYDNAYGSADLATQTVDGKALVIGPGLIVPDRVGPFARLPTAFINGMFMEVSGHDFAAQYMSSGILSLTNTRDYPSIPAILGEATQSFPSHIVLGTAAPLGDTRFTSPPLQAFSSDALNPMVAGPTAVLIGPGGAFPDQFDPNDPARAAAFEQLVGDAHGLIDGLDDLVVGRLPATYQNDLATWRASAAQIQEVYAKRLGGALKPSDEVAGRYGFAPGSSGAGPEESLAAAFLLLKSNLSPYVTVTFASFDSHSDQIAVQLPLMQRFTLALDALVTDLLATDDPSSPGLKLADTTTIYITSEFVRTPIFTVATGGTEHWPSASAILMGRGVQDGAVIGATGDNAEALGWDGFEPVAFSDTTQLLPDHLIATILANIAGESVADTVSAVRLDGLFATKG